MYIKSIPNEAGSYSTPQSTFAKGLIYLPDELLDEYIEYAGFVILTTERDKVTAIEKNTEAYDAYHEGKEAEEENTPETDQTEASIYDELATAYNKGVQEA